ncbi:1406_t:CDS:2 [Rhizophagus irregularis]|nr:1406_t:CDS:2 [Rhizophagus irregularis]
MPFLHGLTEANVPIILKVPEKGEINVDDQEMNNLIPILIYKDENPKKS